MARSVEKRPEQVANDVVIALEGLQKAYRLGTIGTGTLRRDAQSWWARLRGRDDPNARIARPGEGAGGEYFLALDDISIEVRRGDTLGILGANGAGKTTLLKILSRITTPTRGTVSIDGQIASMLGAGTGFHADLTGRDNVYLSGSFMGMRRQEISDKMDSIIEFSECGPFIDTPVKRYSTGMYVRLAFAVAAHLEADILLMDEILATGDAMFQQKCLAKMRELARQEGRTVLYVSHQEETVRGLCNRCVVLDHGRLAYDGGVDEAYRVYRGLAGAAADA